MRSYFLYVLFVLLSIACGVAMAQDVPSGKPEAAIDLATADGVKAVNGQWRYSDTKIAMGR